MATEKKSSELFIKGKNKSWQSVGDGVRRKILGFGPALMMTHVAFDKGSIGIRHAHPHTQVSFIESGKFEVEIGDTVSVLGAGDSYFVPPHVEHGVVALEEGRLLDVFAPIREEFLSSAK